MTLAEMYPGLWEEYEKWHLEKVALNDSQWHNKWVHLSYRDFLTARFTYEVGVNDMVICYPQLLLTLRDMSIL